MIFDIKKLIMNAKWRIFFIALGVIIFFFIVALSPLMAKIQRMHTEWLAQETRLQNIRQLIQTHNKTNSQKNLLTTEEMSWVIDQITQVGRSFSINFISIKPQKLEICPEGDCLSLPIELELEADYKNVGLFLEALDQLEGTVITLRSLKMMKDNPNAVSIKSNLILEVYFQG